MLAPPRLVTGDNAIEPLECLKLLSAANNCKACSARLSQLPFSIRLFKAAGAVRLDQQNEYLYPVPLPLEGYLSLFGCLIEIPFGVILCRCVEEYVKGTELDPVPEILAGKKIEDQLHSLYHGIVMSESEVDKMVSI